MPIIEVPILYACKCDFCERIKREGAFPCLYATKESATPGFTLDMARKLCPGAMKDANGNWIWTVGTDGKIRCPRHTAEATEKAK